MSKLSWAGRSVQTRAMALPVPAFAHRLALKIAHRVRLVYWRASGAEVHGCNVVVSDNQGAILLVRHSYQASGLWMLPGGGLKRGEHVANAAVREVLEETGCRIVEIATFGVDRTTFGGGSRNNVHLVSAATSDSPQADGRELLEAAFFALDALPAEITGAAAERVRRWLEWRVSVEADAGSE